MAAFRHGLRGILLVRRQWLGMGLIAGAVMGCLRFDPFECEDDSECVHDDVAGQCQADTRVCLYPNMACDTQWSSASGECMPAAVDVEEGSGSSTGAPEPGSESSGSSTTGPIDLCDDGRLDPLTGLGVVAASSVYSDNFHAFLAADGDLGTSWFSSGPEPGNLPSTFSWTVLDPHCIAELTVTGNGQHQNPGFREDFGFGSLIVRIFDDADDVVFQEMISLAGTPDPTVVLDPRVIGVRIELTLSEHESSDCGGFAELEVKGR